MKFFLGFLVGALVVVGVQLRFAPIPYPSEDDAAMSGAPPAANPATQSQEPTRVPAEMTRDSGSTWQPVASQNSSRDSATSPQSQTGDNDARISLPDTHAGFVAKDGPSLPDEHEKLEQEEVDSVWADQVRGLIADYVANHRLGQSVFVVSLRCKTTRCEIAGTVFGDQGREIWDTIQADMQAQSWFASFFEDSVYGAGGAFPGEYRFVTILARAGSETTTPVSP